MNNRYFQSVGHHLSRIWCSRMVLHLRMDSFTAPGLNPTDFTFILAGFLLMKHEVSLLPKALCCITNVPS